MKRLTLALLLAIAMGPAVSTSEAQVRYYRGWHNGWNGGYRNYGGWNRGYYYRPYYGGWNRGYYGPGGFGPGWGGRRGGIFFNF